MREAELAYRDIRSGNPHRLRVLDGRVVSTGMVARVKEKMRMSRDRQIGRCAPRPAWSS
ncbi:hypothetical protein [Duganella callida]|uniref:hypothetical protein n=1 Tax=Duganella callida TaxID=2561932 RepID=UPI00197AE899|nr:hypothetical protein [Duganella callida]